MNTSWLDSPVLIAVIGDGTLELVVNANTPPSVSVTAPVANSTVSGSAVSVAASASDNVAVVEVQFC